MADLPANTQYGASGATPTPRQQFPKLNINPAGAGRSAMPPTMVGADAQHPFGVQTPTDTPLGAPMPTKTAPVGTDYSTFQQRANNSYERNANLIIPKLPTLHQMPDPTMGEYVFDQTQPSNAMVKSNREFVTQDVKAKILGALPSALFQVDHIIPLWAGGADTPQNLQILPLSEHGLKTKVQAVPLTLLSAGVINYDQARVMSANWKNLDATGIPDMSDNGNGLLDVKTAQSIYDRWKKEETQGRPATWSDIKKGIPTAAQNFGKGWLPDWIREPIKGFASGATGGILPYKAGENEGLIPHALGIGGEIAGSIWGLGKFTKILRPGLALLGIKAFAPAAVTLSELAPTLERAGVLGTKVAKAVAPAAEAANALPKLSLGKKVVLGVKSNLGSYMGYLRQNAASNIMRNTAILVPYGIATGIGKSILSAHEEGTLQEMSKRLVQDIGLGAVTGIAPPGLKGALGAAFGTYVLDSALGTPWREAMLNGAMIGGLHGVGTLAPAKVNSAALHANVEKEATSAMQNILHWWVPEVPEVTNGKASQFHGLAGADDATRALRIKDAEEWTDKAQQKLLGLKDSVSSDEFQMYRNQIVTAGHYLRQAALPAAERDAAMLADMASVFEQGKKRTFGLTVPETVPDFMKAAGEERLFQPIVREPNVADTPTTGEIRMAGSGIAGVNEQNMVKFQAAAAQGRASQNLLVVNRPDTRPLWELMSQNMTKDEITNLINKPFSNPQNAAQIYGLVKGESGVELLPLGWLPRRFTIDEKKFSFNSQPEIQNGTFPRNNPERNKDSIAMRMNQEDAPVVTMRLEKLEVPDHVRKGTRRPNQAGSYLIGRIAEADWENSKQFWQQFKAESGDITPRVADPQPLASGSLAGEMPQPLPSAPSAQTVQDTIAQTGDLATRDMKAQDVLANPILSATSKPGQKTVADYMSTVDDVITLSKDEDEVATNLLNIGLSKEIATRASAGETITAKDVVSSLRKENLLGEEASLNAERVLGPDKASWFAPGSPEEAWGHLPVSKGRAPKEATPVEAPVEPISGSQELAQPVEAPIGEVPPVPVETAPMPPQAPQRDISQAIVARATKGDVPIRPIKRSAAPQEAVAEAAAPVAEVALDPAAPVETPQVADEAYAPALEGLKQIGLENSRSYDAMPLDSYVEKMSEYIRNYRPEGISDPVQIQTFRKKLATDAMNLLNKEDLDLRMVSMGKSEEAYNKNIRGLKQDSIGEYLDAERNKIANEFDAEPPPAPERVVETGQEKKERVSSAVKQDAEPYLKMIREWDKLSPMTYQFGHNMTFDTLAKNIWGPNYTKNYNLMRFFSDKDRLGRDWYHKGMSDPEGNPVRDKRGQEVGGLFNTETPDGKQISQPKDYVEARGVGDKEKAKDAIARRYQALGAARNRINQSQDEGALAKPIEEAADLAPKELTSSYRIEDSTQAASENVQDLTKYESENLHGLLSAIESGPNPNLQAVRGAEDATTQIFKLIEGWNLAVKNGYVNGSKVRLKDNEILNVLKKRLSTEVESAKAMKKELAQLEKSTDALKRTTVSGDHQKDIDQQIADNEARMEELRTNLKEPAPVKEEAVADGQGGPGFDINSPAISPSMAFPSLQSMDIRAMPGSTPAVMPPRPAGPTVLGPTTTFSTIGTQQQTAAAPASPVKALDIHTPMKAIGESTTKINAADATAKALEAVKAAPMQAFKGLQDRVAGLVDSAAGNKPISARGGGYKPDPNAVIMGIDTTRYATDPKHAQKLNSIVHNMPPNVTNPAVAEAYIRSKFPKSPVTGSMVVQAAQKHGVPVPLLIAMMQNDSSMGTAGLGAKTRNPGNVGNDDDGNIRKYPSWQAGVEAVAAWLGNHRALAKTT